MIYTVGSKKAYFRSLLKNGKVIKSGRKRGYAGGCVFRTRCERATEVCETVPPLAGDGLRRVACWHPLDRPA